MLLFSGSMINLTIFGLSILHYWCLY